MPTYEAFFWFFFSHEDTLGCLSGRYGGCAVIPKAPLCWQGPSGHSTLKAGPSTDHNINTPAFYFTGTYQDTWHRPTDPQLGTTAATVLNRSKKTSHHEAHEKHFSVTEWVFIKSIFFCPYKHLFTVVALGAFQDLIWYFPTSMPEFKEINTCFILTSKIGGKFIAKHWFNIKVHIKTKNRIFAL